MTTHFWLAIACGILWIAGVWTAFKPGMILGDIGDWLEYYAKLLLGKEGGEYVCKPLFRCPPCMASIHGTYVWFAVDGGWWGLVPYCICLCGANAFLFIVFTDD